MQLSNSKSEPEAVAMPTSLDRYFVEGDETASTGRRRRRGAFGISFAIEAAVLAVLIISPLLSSVAQPNFSRSVFMPFVFGTTHTQHTIQHTSTPTHIQPNRFWKSITYPVPGSRPAPPTPVEADYISADQGLYSGPVGLDLFQFEGFRPVSPPEPPRKEARKIEDKGPVELSESVVQAQLISRIEPRYPTLALETRTQGTVRLRAIISRDGRITALEVLSGHPLLVQAALDAVRQWRYRPTMLNGEPVEVETSITVYFRLE